MFIPLIISSGGNSGSQASTLIVRSLALSELRLRDWWRVFLRELRSAATLGTWLGFIGFLRISLWHHLGWTDYGEHHFSPSHGAQLDRRRNFGFAFGQHAARKLCRFDPVTSSGVTVATLQT